MKFYIVDASSYLFRAYFAIKNMKSPSGQSTNALYGFTRAILKLLNEEKPDFFLIVFDAKNNKDSRLSIYPEYKGKRNKIPEDLPSQIELGKEISTLLGLPILSIEGVEADDTIGTVARLFSSKVEKVLICSGDKDLCQLVDDKIVIFQTHKDNQIVGKQEVLEQFGVFPSQIIDYLALMGDASDNIPGLEGVGPKKAAKLLQQYEHLEKIPLTPQEVSLALLSKQLATIDCKVPVPEDEEFYRPKPANIEQINELFFNLGFKSLITTEQGTKTKKEESVNYQTISDPLKVRSLVDELLKESLLVIDTETTSLSIEEAKLVGIGFSPKEKIAYYIPYTKENFQELLPLLNSKTIGWIGHHLKYDLHILKKYNVELVQIAFDTLIASYLVHPDESHKLEDLLQKHFAFQKTGLDDLEKRCLEDVDYTYRLKSLYQKELEKLDLIHLFETMELPLMKILFQMEEEGIFVDQMELKTLASHFSKRTLEIKVEVEEVAKHPLNLNSPKQLSYFLFEELKISPVGKTKTGYSTNIETLEEIKSKHPVVPLIIEYRGVEKLRSTYTDTLIEQISTKDGRIHTTFSQTTTQTGRLASVNPNLQNIPIRTKEGNLIRKAFKPQKAEYSFISADYSQAELRILAHFSEDPNLLLAFQQHLDIHEYTASLVFDVPLQEVTKEMRNRAKAVNFGIIYGLGPHGLSKNLDISMQEASSFIKKYFQRYKHVEAFIESAKEEVRKTGYSKTLFGRLRPIPEIHSKNAVLRNQAERFSVNSKIQGTQADLIKLAMIDLQDKIDRDNKMLLQIHDELIFECPDRLIEQQKVLIQKRMGQIYPLKAPLEVDVSVAKNWGDC